MTCHMVFSKEFFFRAMIHPSLQGSFSHVSLALNVVHVCPPMHAFQNIASTIRCWLSKLYDPSNQDHMNETRPRKSLVWRFGCVTSHSHQADFRINVKANTSCRAASPLRKDKAQKDCTQSQKIFADIPNGMRNKKCGGDFFWSHH